MDFTQSRTKKENRNLNLLIDQTRKKKRCKRKENSFPFSLQFSFSSILSPSHSLRFSHSLIPHFIPFLSPISNCIYPRLDQESKLITFLVSFPIPFLLTTYGKHTWLEPFEWRTGIQMRLNRPIVSFLSFQVPTSSLKTLNSLISLNIGYNLLEVLPARAFTGLISLLRLSLFGNRIALIDPLAFDGIGGNLTRINLGGNLLTSVPTSSLKELQSLQVRIHSNTYFYLLYTHLFLFLSLSWILIE